MNSRIDLHLHSTASDGRLSPTEVVKLAASRGLRLIALTDHDTTNGCDEAQAQGVRENLRVIAGVELNTDSNLGEVHILGYFKHIHHPKLQDALDGLRIKREERARQIVEKLNSIGVAITYDQVKAQSKDGAVGRPHVAFALAANGSVGSKDAAFDLYLGNGKPGYVQRYAFHPKEAIELIRSCGGVASLAHSFRSGSIQHVEKLVGWGLNAIEVYYFDHDADRIEQLKILSKQFNLLHTGGSDFHYVNSDGSRGIGSVWVPEEVGEAMNNKTMKNEQ